MQIVIAAVLFLSPLCARFAVGQTRTDLFATQVPTATGWERPDLAQGPIGTGGPIACGDSNSAINRSASNTTHLVAQNFDQYTLPPRQVITDIRVNVHAKYANAPPSGQVRVRIEVPGFAPLIPGPITITSQNGECDFIVSPGINIIGMAPFASNPDLVNQVVVMFRRQSSNDPPNLRVNGFRIVVFTELDTDSDTIPDLTDPDDDGDGVADEDDKDPLNRFICGIDVDDDGCDDCARGLLNRYNDGPDCDQDGLCDSGDDDIDNDGAEDNDIVDPFPCNRFACGDSDGDGCDDCSSGTFDLVNDGPDCDRDGVCDSADPDDDNDGVNDGQDPQPCNPLICGDSNRDGCDDCSNPPDLDGDSLCDFGDPDIDGDGVLNGLDSHPRYQFLCRDDDRDGCDDCSSGTYNTYADGPDSDDDGVCNSDDPSPFNPNSCGDSDGDGCDDCGSGHYDPQNDYHPPVIDLQPSSALTCRSRPATFSVEVEDPTPQINTYVWEFLDSTGCSGNPSGTWVPVPIGCCITCGPGGTGPRWTYSGSNTPNLTIAPLPAERLGRASEGFYRLRVQNGCGQVLSEEVILRLCVGDYNCDDFVDSQDFFAFIDDFFVRRPGADITGDGRINSQDFFDFIATFFAGC